MSAGPRPDDPVLRLGSLFEGTDPPPVPLPPRAFDRARLFYLAIGVLGVLVALLQLSISREDYHEAVMRSLRRGPGGAAVDEVDPDVIRSAVDQAFRTRTILAVVTLVLNAAFLAIAILMPKFPLPTTFLGVVLYMALSAFAVVQAQEHGGAPSWIGAGLRLLICVALIRTFVAELTYQRHLARLGLRP